jgi:hypothetical protein
LLRLHFGCDVFVFVLVKIIFIVYLLLDEEISVGLLRYGSLL